MGREIDLLVNYPKTKRKIEDRAQEKTEEDRSIARRFGREFFDGNRRHGYGGFTYHPRFWKPVIPTMQRYFGLAGENSVLDVGCAKGFMLHDIVALIPDITVKGIDISSYAIENAIEDMKPYIQVADACRLPFQDKSFDVVISINTIHNLDIDECAQSLREIERVQCKGSFITVDAFRTEEEKRRMYSWNLTARTIMSVEEWIKLFDKVGYTGDYYWFIP